MTLRFLRTVFHISSVSINVESEERDAEFFVMLDGMDRRTYVISEHDEREDNEHDVSE